MKTINSNTAVKYKAFAYYKQKYHRNLNETNSLIEPLNLLCGGWFLQTFKQVINKLSTNKSSPLPLFFPNSESMELVTKNKGLRQQVFNAFDTRSIKRIDACQLYCALITVSKGSYQIFLKTIVDVFGFQYPGRILRDEFFFFLDSFFRAIPKIVILKNYTKPIDPNIRLEYGQINGFIKTIFGQKEQIERNQIYQSMIKEVELNEFIRYIQKRCNGSAQRCRNETIERVAIESEVRAWLTLQIDKIQAQENQHRHDQFQKILD